MTEPTLGYWDIRSLAQPIRYLLKYVGVKFIDKRYPFGEGTGLQDIENIRKYWIPEKFNLGLDFPNLPFYIDGDLKITQSLAILRYLGRKHGLVAIDTKSLAQQDMIEQQLQDLLVSFVWVLLKDPNYETVKQIFIKNTLETHLELLSKFLGNNEWFIGSLTYVDFLAYELIDWFRLFSPESVQKWENLTQYIERFESLPPIKTYITSGEFNSWPVFGPICKWGYFK